MKSLIKKILNEGVRDNFYTGKDVINHITDITPNEEDLPRYFMDNLIKPRKFELKKISLLDLVNSDSSFKEYYESGEERYDYDEVDTENLNYELVVVDGELLDGYSRASSLLNNGTTETWAFVAIPRLK